MNLAVGVFWGSLLLLLYTWALYPVGFAVLSRLRGRAVVRDGTLRSVDVVLPVHNGAPALAAKIENCLAQDYPEDRRTIHVVSDGSTDETVAVAAGYADRGVRCRAIPERVGKVAAQNRVLLDLQGEVVVFTDVSTRVPPDALRHIVSSFGDPAVGVVSCRDQIEPRRAAEVGESLYTRYEMMLRGWTAQAGTLIGVTGGFYAVRRGLTEGGWNPAYPPDFYAALTAIKHGYRVVEDERVVASYAATSEPSQEFARKVRTFTRAMFALFENAQLLNPVRFGAAAIQLWSHKVLRWLTPAFTLALFASASCLAFLGHERLVPMAVSISLASVFLLGLIGYRLPGEDRGGIWILRPTTFAVLSIAALGAAWLHWAQGRRFTQWTPTRRD